MKSVKVAGNDAAWLEMIAPLIFSNYFLRLRDFSFHRFKNNFFRATVADSSAYK